MKNFLSILCIGLVSVAAYAQSPNRSTPPELTKAKNLQLSPIERFALSNGLKVVLLEKHTVPLLEIDLLVKTGSFDDPAGKEGLANFTFDLMDEGANGMDALKLADEIDFLGTTITTFAGNFSSGIDCLTPVSKLEPSLKLMSNIALQPTFSDADIERVRGLRLNGLLQDYDEPRIIARRAFDKFMYATNTPYGKFASEGSIRAYTKADLTAFHKANFIASNSTLIIVGDITRKEIAPILEKYFAAFPTGTSTPSIKPVPQQVKSRSIYLIDKPGAAQSVIRIGRIGTSRADEDYNAIVVMNTILGGSFTSRLNSNLREEHGYAYGASSGFAFWQVPGPFVASSAVQTDVTGPALGEFFNEFKKMRLPMPDADYERGKNYEALGYAGNFETNASIASALAELVLYNLDDNYFNTYVGRILAVSKKDLEAAAKKYIVPENMVIIVVGDRSKIEKGIKALNLGPITNLSIEAVLGKKPKL